MALPDGFLDELRSRLTLSDVAGRKVTWDRRKSNPSRGDFWAPCPFHQEKTPSFHVEDRKGFYYCFGCHAKGDLIGFVMQAENLGFMEAVERLAAEAGLEVPKDRADPHAAEKRDRAARLAEVMEEAVRLYARAFRAGAGAGARDYASGRRLDAETLARFEIGYAPASRSAQTEHFRAAGTLEDAIAAGLVIRPEDGGAPYDRFRDRLMFPIRDGRGRCIAFGGRALGPGAKAKYLNSPETELFHKGRVLYNEGPAREAAGRSGRLILAEGYMDVIALAAHGFAEAAAPLGTAVTEAQLQRAWRIAEEPVIALDGDAAGLRAAQAVVDLALPHLAPGRSLAFCVMPPGEDPDDVLGRGGVAAMEALLSESVPLVEMLWRRETEGRALDTPERRAALEARIRAALGRIGNGAVRAHYAEALRARRDALFGRGRGGGAPGGGSRPRGQRPWRGGAEEGPCPSAKSSWLARDGGETVAEARRGREAGILAIAFAYPEAAAALEAEIDELDFADPALEALRRALLAALAEGRDPEEAAARATGAAPSETLARVPQRAALAAVARPGKTPAEARAQLAEIVARHRARLGAEAELAEAGAEIAEAEGEDWTHRVRAAGAMPMAVDMSALKQGPGPARPRRDALGQMLARAKAGGYRRKKPGFPSSNQ